MNKIINLGAMLTIAAGAVVFNTSCSSDNDLGKFETIKQQEFKKAFTAEFGNIASGHTWGFGAVEIPTLGQATTKAAAPNSNQWFDPNQQYKLVKPEFITDHEIEVVSQWFKEHKNPVSTPVNLTDFFVMQVYNENKQTYTGTDNNGTTHTVTPAGYMNWICVEENGNAEHINNLNSNTPAYKAENNTGSFPTTGIQYMQNSSTAKWGFKDSYGENTVKWDFVICAIEVDGKIGYYVGYDYSSKKPEAELELGKDGYYNDRILKVVPAVHTTQKRIIAEDLGASNGSDFDYNDVVFDAFVYSRYNNATGRNEKRAVITLLAAGGTLPIYIGSGEDRFEVHEAFGVSTSTMVNTIAGKKNEYAPVQKDIFLAVDNYDNKYDVNDIPVEVQYGEGDSAFLHALVGKAPEKICVKPTFDWCDEYQNISIKYPSFKEYVGDPVFKWY